MYSQPDDCMKLKEAYINNENWIRPECDIDRRKIMISVKIGYML